MRDFPEVARADSASPHFEEEEQAKAAAHAPLRPRLIHEIIRGEGEAELRRPVGALAWSGLASGLSMGFSFLTQALLRSNLPDEPWRHLIDSFGYSVGFIIVVLGRQQLFTESTLRAVLRHCPERQPYRHLPVRRHDPARGPIASGGLSHPRRARDSDDGVAFLGHAVEGNLRRIALMVWLLPSAGSARLFVILLLTYVVALGHLSHIIADSVEAAFAVLDRQASLGGYVTAFLLPTLIGNTIGGVSLVAFLNHAPLSAERGVPSGAE